MLMKQLEKQKNHPFDMGEVKEVREGFEKMTLKIKPAKGIDLEEILIGNIPTEKYSLSSNDSKNSTSYVILYLHGGGYFMGSYLTHRGFVSRLCKKLHLQAYSINYRISGNNKKKAA